jgi:hypothetical protein
MSLLFRIVGSSTDEFFSVPGNYIFSASSSPLLKKVIYSSTKKVPCVDERYPNKTVYEMWSTLSDKKDNDYNNDPQ